MHLAADEEQEPASVPFEGGVGSPQPIVELPTFVPAPQGKVTFWADFAHVKENSVPLFLVNRSDTIRDYQSQDGDLYIKLEYKNSRGKWIRAQAHLSSWCGNSYYSLSLRPGQFFAFHGYLPSKGKKQVVRYASTMNGNLISNEGEGLISETDVRNAARDPLAARKVPLVVRRWVEVDKREPHDRGGDWLKRAAAIRVLLMMDRNEAALKWVQNWKDILSADPDSAEAKEVHLAADEVLSHAWPEEMPPDALFARCLAAVTLPRSGKAKHGTLEGEPVVLWGLLVEMCGPVSPWEHSEVYREADLGKLKPLWTVAAKVALEEPEEVAHAAAFLLGNASITDQLIPTRRLEDWLTTPNEVLQDIAAKALARRMQYERLAELGMTLSPKAQLKILHVLAYGENDWPGKEQVVRGFGSMKEMAFWSHCMDTQLLDAVVTLWGIRSVEDRNPFDRLVHDPLLHYLKKEAERAAKLGSYDLGADGQKLLTAVRMFGSWHLEEDVPVLKLLLDHPGTLRSQGLVIRHIAKEALIRQGIEISQK